MLSVDRHHIGMSRQDQTTLDLRPDMGVKRRLFAVRHSDGGQ